MITDLPDTIEECNIKLTQAKQDYDEAQDSLDEARRDMNRAEERISSLKKHLEKLKQGKVESTIIETLKPIVLARHGWPDICIVESVQAGEPLDPAQLLRFKQLRTMYLL